MPITLQFAFRVRALRRMGLTAERIAVKLSASLENVMEGRRVMDLPLNDTYELVRYRRDTEREAELERYAEEMEERARKARR